MTGHRPPLRPVFFEPLRTSLPITALVSISHRLSGLALVFAVPLVLMGLSCSLKTEASFLFLQHRLTVCPFAQTFVFGTMVAWIFHALAGIRHLLMDLHFFEELPAARFTAFLIVATTAILSIVIGGFLLWV